MTSVIVVAKEELRNLIREAVRAELATGGKSEAWLSVSIVADRLGKSEKTIRAWIKDGRFTRYSGGDGRPYLVSSLEVEELRRSANSSPDAS